MPADERIEAALARALAEAITDDTPPRLASALWHAVLPGGARLRPRLTIAVANASGGAPELLANAAAVAVELVHCASLVHDDLPCFDDAVLRRGEPTVHKLYGENLAVLAGDGLIVQAFAELARGAASAPALARPLVAELARSIGVTGGIVAGQAWESEPKPDVAAYHRAKTGALFEAAASLGAIVAGAEPAPWRRVGGLLGEAYQVADDIADCASSAAAIGKPVGRDQALARASAVRARGLDGALEHFDALIEKLAASVPDCPGRDELRRLVIAAASRLLPAGVGRRVARARRVAGDRTRSAVAAPALARGSGTA